MWRLYSGISQPELSVRLICRETGKAYIQIQIGIALQMTKAARLATSRPSIWCIFQLVSVQSAFPSDR